VLKGRPARCVAAGSGAITGFPYVHSRDPKVLRYLGTAVNEARNIEEVSRRYRDQDRYITQTTDDVTERVIPSESFDVLDTEYFSLRSWCVG